MGFTITFVGKEHTNILVVYILVLVNKHTRY